MFGAAGDIFQKSPKMITKENRNTIDQVFAAAVAWPDGNEDFGRKWAYCILQADYEGALMAAFLKGKKRVFLTLMGGGVFLNKFEDIFEAMYKQKKFIEESGLEVILIWRPGDTEFVQKHFTELKAVVDVIGGEIKFDLVAEKYDLPAIKPQSKPQAPQPKVLIPPSYIPEDPKPRVIPTPPALPKQPVLPKQSDLPATPAPRVTPKKDVLPKKLVDESNEIEKDSETPRAPEKQGRTHVKTEEPKKAQKRRGQKSKRVKARKGKKARKSKKARSSNRKKLIRRKNQERIARNRLSRLDRENKDNEEASKD